jgi:hypothetical protein
METSIMSGFQQMAQFMNNHVFNAPFWQEQQIGGEADGLATDIADAPTRNHRPITDSCWLYAHLLGVKVYHWLYLCFQTAQGIVSLLSCL